MTAAIKLTAPAIEDLSQEPYYPYCDGEPMAESDLHAQAMLYCLAVLQKHFESRSDVYVAGDNFLYYVQGQPRMVVSPDCYVVFGADSQPRKSYKAWEADGLLPSVVIEVTSASTQGEDVERKFRLYQDVLHVAEYFLYDPTGDYIPARLVGYRLIREEATVNSVYERIQPDTEGRLHSEQLGLYLVIENTQLRFFDPVRGILYQTYGEALDRADSEAQARAILEAELAQMRAAFEALQKQVQEAAELQSAGDRPQDEQE